MTLVRALRSRAASGVGHPWRRRSAAFRRGGPGQDTPIARARQLGARAVPQRTGPGLARGLLAGYVAAAVVLAVTRKRSGVRPAVTLGVASVAPLAAAAAMPPGRWRPVVAGVVYMWLFELTWELPYDDPQRLRERLHVRYPIRADTWLGRGVPPTLRLQRALRRGAPDRVSGLDRAVVAVYGSWVVPHLLLGWVWRQHPEYLPRAAGRLAAAYHLTTPFYWLLPTAPPWWASEVAGELDGDVRRVRHLVLRDLRGRPAEDPSDQPHAGNPWGSMPSDHIASATITAMALSEISAVYGALGWTYVALAGFSVVYLGEHYLVDVLAGVAIAEAIRLVEPVAGPLVRRVTRGVDDLTA